MDSELPALLGMINSYPHLLILIAALSTSCTWAQNLSFGIKTGARLNGAQDPDAQNRDESRFYTVGPMMELRLPRQMGVEIDALYRRMGTSGGECSTVFLICGFSRSRANAWGFPIIVKRRFAIAAHRCLAESVTACNA
jgi:hypothetical protein